LKKDISHSSGQEKNKEDSRLSKGPLSYLSGAITSGVFSWLCFGLSKKAVAYFMVHQPSYKSAIAQSIASAMKTLVIGMSFLATFTFAFIGLGLILVFLRDLISGNEGNPA